MEKTHWKKLTNPDYLGSYSIDEGSHLDLTIGVVRQEQVIGADGKKEECIVCHWKERDAKPMILNSTNCKMITKLLKTPYIDEWSGHKIRIKVERVKAFGDVVDALRVDKTLPKEDKKIICECCGNPIKAAYGMSVEQLAEYISKQPYANGLKLCAECATKAKEAVKNEAKANEAGQE